MRAGFRRWPVQQPGDEADDEARDGARYARRDAVGLDHQPDVPFGRALGGEHADRAEAALGQTVKPPTLTRAMSSMPRMAAAIEIVPGLMALPLASVWASDTADPLGSSALIASGLVLRASNSTVTWLGAVTWPGDDEGELIQQALRVLHDAGDRPG